MVEVVVESFEEQLESEDNQRNKEIKKYEYVVHRGEDEESRKQREAERDEADQKQLKKNNNNNNNKTFRAWFKEMAIMLKFPSLTIRIVMMLHPLAAITSFYTVSHAKSQLLLNPPLFVSAACVGGLCILFPFALFRFVQKTASSQFHADEAFKPTLNKNKKKEESSLLSSSSSSSSNNEGKENNNNKNNIEEKEEDRFLGGLLFFMEMPEHLYFYKSERDLNKISACCCFHDDNQKTEQGDLDRTFLERQQEENFEESNDDEFENLWKSFSLKLRRVIRSLLPVGRYGPSSRFRRFGSPVSRLLPHWTVSYAPWESIFVNALAFLLAVPLRTWTGCIVQYLLIAFLAFWNLIVTWKIQPFRSKLFWLTHGATWLSLIVICLAATLVRTAPWIVHVIMLPAFTVLFGVAIFDLFSSFVIFVLLEWKGIDGKKEELWTWSDAIVEEMEEEDEEEDRMKKKKKKKNNLSSLFLNDDVENDSNDKNDNSHSILTMMNNSSSSNSGLLETSASISRDRKNNSGDSDNTSEMKKKKSNKTNSNNRVVSFGRTGGGALTLTELQRCLALPDDPLNDAPIQQLGDLLNRRHNNNNTNNRTVSSSPKNQNQQQQQKKKRVATASRRPSSTTSTQVPFGSSSSSHPSFATTKAEREEL